ncbi:hypothetical protein GCM10010168_76190 [Actinoplanes ianthinogenes]|uniref:Uncharacterized protein n=1 Tax=Actinoplanes ianthinogenes TaxID=122358 RepID=A0ABM7M9V2_9ACTN|nr:hypothetical protein Aiant_91120 [Actinoplanes ianthinogenes]GGR46244.1 hypothetical protein GCM10010168_76190 [Actinoplanes ianthinogenes]
MPTTSPGGEAAEAGWAPVKATAAGTRAAEDSTVRRDTVMGAPSQAGDIDGHRDSARHMHATLGRTFEIFR